MLIIKSPLLTPLATAFYIVLSFNSYSQNNSPAEKSIVNFQTEDGITIYGDYIKVNADRPIILLFHQGRSNARGEYGSIIPKLIEQNFSVLAIDQRLGGDLYGDENRTVKNILKTYEYCDAIADLKAAYAYAVNQGFANNIILWGSSYSGSLAIQLAYDNQKGILGVLAFSPSSGGPMQNCKADDFFKGMEVPLLLLRPSKELEILSVKKQWDSAQYHDHKTYLASKGTHGSSMLVAERVGRVVEENWNVVFSFLKEITDGHTLKEKR